jgi:hypothetical protein
MADKGRLTDDMIKGLIDQSQPSPVTIKQPNGILTPMDIFKPGGLQTAQRVAQTVPIGGVGIGLGGLKNVVSSVKNFLTKGSPKVFTETARGVKQSLSPSQLEAAQSVKTSGKSWQEILNEANTKRGIGQTVTQEFGQQAPMAGGGLTSKVLKVGAPTAILSGVGYGLNKVNENVNANTMPSTIPSTNIPPLSLTPPSTAETMSNVKANEFPTTETTPNKNTTPAPSTEMSGILPDGSYGIFGTKQDNTAYNQERDIANARIDAQRAEDLKKVELDNAIFREENRVLGGGTDPEMLRYLKEQKYGAKGVNPMQDVQSREANATTRFGMEKTAETAKANQQATQNYHQQQLQQTAQKLAWDEKVDYTKLNQEQRKIYLDQADKLLKRDADYSGRLWKDFEVRDNDGTGNPQPEKTLFNIAKSGVKLPETDTNLINMVNQINQRRLAFQRSKYGDAKLTTEQMAQVDKDFMETLK